PPRVQVVGHAPPDDALDDDPGAREHERLASAFWLGVILGPAALVRARAAHRAAEASNEHRCPRRPTRGEPHMHGTSAQSDRVPIGGAGSIGSVTRYAF